MCINILRLSIPSATCVLAVCIALTAGSGRASIVIDAGEIRAQAQESFPATPNNSSNTGSFDIPAVGASLTASYAQSSSANTVNWTTSAGTVALLIGFDHVRNGSTNGAGGSITSYALTTTQGTAASGILFTVQTNDVDYSLDGEYYIEHPGDYVFSASLLDVTSSTSLFSLSLSQVTSIPQTLTLTGAGSTGTLLAGHQYQWAFHAQSSSHNDYRDPDDSVQSYSSSGFVALTLISESIDPGTPGVVPEATSFLIWGLLGLAFAAGGWKTRVRP